LTDEVIGAAEELKRGLMQRLLTQGIGHTEYKQTPLGKTPKTWKIYSIKDVCEKPQYGYTESATEAPIGPKFIRITDIQDGVVDWNTVPYCKCNDKDHRKYKIQKNDILFARTGATTGKSYIIKEEVDAVFASYLIRLICTSKIHADYLHTFFNSHLYWRQINQNKVGAAQGGINASILSELLLPYPTLEEQKKIAEVIREVDLKIDIEIEKKKNLNLIKRGLMQLLLSGKVRVELREDGLHRVGDNRETHN